MVGIYVTGRRSCDAVTTERRNHVGSSITPRLSPRSDGPGPNHYKSLSFVVIVLERAVNEFNFKVGKFVPTARAERIVTTDDRWTELLPGKMGATGIANLEIPYAVGVRPTPLRVDSGASVGGYGGFVVRAPIIGPGVRAIVINSGVQTYDFTVWGYATH